MTLEDQCIVFPKILQLHLTDTILSSEQILEMGLNAFHVLIGAQYHHQNHWRIYFDG